MVAQCKNCQTKFKFDETLIEGEGIWVRCNQCKNVFFLDNPAEAGKTAPSNERKRHEYRRYERICILSTRAQRHKGRLC